MEVQTRFDYNLESYLSGWDEERNGETVYTADI